jgi:uncharacterized protein (TIGR00290 family)
MIKQKAIFCWSGGKDSALALYKISLEDKIEVVALMTTLNARFRRVSMHGLREDLVEQQAKSIGLPLIKMYVAEGSNVEYERNMEAVLLKYKEQGVEKIIFGDIFLDDLREYREKNLSKIGLTAEFPLWKQDTSVLINEFLALQFKTIICCVNDASLTEEDAGKEVSSEYIRSLPEQVDPCGENGEYHTFCYEGPIFTTPVKFSVGEKVYRPLEIKSSEGHSQPIKTKGFWFCDLIPA